MRKNRKSESAPEKKLIDYVKQEHGVSSFLFLFDDMRFVLLLFII